MRFIGFGDYDWEADGYWCGIPQGGIGLMALQPTILQRPGTTPTFGVNALSERNFSVEFGYDGALTYEQAWDNLLTRLRPTDAAPRELRAIRNDGTRVAIDAVLILRGQTEEVNILQATFVSVAANWAALDSVTSTKTVTIENDNVVPLSITGFVQPEVLVTITPTANRTTATSVATGYKYRRTVTITNSSGRVIPANYPYAIGPFDANTAYNGGVNSKIRLDMADLRVVRNGVEIARTLSASSASGASSLRIWIRLLEMGVGAVQTVQLWYGNPSATTPITHDSETTPERMTIAFVPTSSTNTSWVYTGRALWGGSGVATKPEHWRRAMARNVRDAQSVNIGNTGTTTGNPIYIARATATSTRLNDGAGWISNNSLDSVYFTSNAGIASVSYTLSYWGNLRNATSDPNWPVAVWRLRTGGPTDAALRDDPATTNPNLYSNNAKFTAVGTGPVVNTAVTVSPPANTVWTQVAFALIPAGIPVPTSVDSGRPGATDVAAVARAIFSNPTVTLSATISNVVGTEEEVYDWATQVRVGGSNASDAPGAGIPYAVARIGNWKADATPAGRYVTPLNTTITFNTATGEVYETSAAGTVRPVPASAIEIKTRSATSTTELSAAKPWYGVPAVINPVSNNSFAVNATGWTRGTVTAGVTVGMISRSTAQTDRSGAATGVGSIVQTVGAGAGLAWEYYWGTMIPVAGRKAVTVAAELRTTNASLYPRLAIWFYTGAQAFISRTEEPTWTYTINQWFRRCFTATVPASAGYYRVGIVAWQTGATAQTGTIFLDDIDVNDNDLIVDDKIAATGFGTLVVAASWKPTYP